MSYEIKIGQRSITVDSKIDDVSAPNTRMAAMYKGMRDAFSDLRATGLVAESEAAALERIHSNPDYTDAAKSRRRKETVNPETLRKFRQGAAAVSAQAANILDYLKRELRPVEPLADGDVQGFMRDSELREVFRSMDGSTQSRLISAMHRGEQTDLCDAVLRTNPLCSAITEDQYARLALSRISTDNLPVVQSVEELVAAAYADLVQITAVRVWYSNLVFGQNEDPDQYSPRVKGLLELSAYASTMVKINQRQGDPSQANPKEPPADPENNSLTEWNEKWNAAHAGTEQTA